MKTRYSWHRLLAGRLTNEYNKFWTCINRMNGATREAEITDTSCRSNTLRQRYNSVNDGARYKFYNRLMNMILSVLVTTTQSLYVMRFIIGTRNAVGYDGIAIEAAIWWSKSYCTFCFLCNLFVTYGYVALSFMQSVVIPLVKCKSGDLSELNNYRAIAISTSFF